MIPVVSESLSMSVPGGHSAYTPDHNVWASGAATAAFDAFSDHVPDAAVVDPHPPGTSVVDQPADHATNHSLADWPNQAGDPAGELPAFDTGLDRPMPDGELHVVDDSAAGVTDAMVHQHHVVDDHGFAAEHPGFDIF